MRNCPECGTKIMDGTDVCPNCKGSFIKSDENEDFESLKEYRAYPETNDHLEKIIRGHAPIYVKKSQKYEDLKSSAWAFLTVGVITLLFSLLCWTGFISLPAAGVSKILYQTVITILGAASLAISANSYRSAISTAGQIADEEQQTKDLIAWFTETYHGEELDQQIDREFPDISEDEKNLKRFDLISDLLITNHNLPSQSYVDALCEEIYSCLYES